MTNEEWFINLQTEDKALFMAAQGKYKNDKVLKLMLYSTAKTLNEWLKSEYKGGLEN